MEFLRSTQKFAQSSSCFERLLSKRPMHKEDFFQILRVSQKFRTLILEETVDKTDYSPCVFMVSSQ